MRVVVADDVMLTRRASRGCSRRRHRRRRRGGDADGLLRQVARRRPDAVIVDIRMPPTHTDEGLVAAATDPDAHPGIGVLVLSQYVEPRYAMRLLGDQPGGVGYLLKERVSDVAVLIDAVRRIADGETVIDPAIVSRLLGRRRRPTRSTSSAREREVLGLVAEGLRTGRSRSGCTSPSGPSRRT